MPSVLISTKWVFLIRIFFLNKSLKKYEKFYICFCKRDKNTCKNLFKRTKSAVRYGQPLFINISYSLFHISRYTNINNFAPLNNFLLPSHILVSRTHQLFLIPNRKISIERTSCIRFRRKLTSRRSTQLILHNTSATLRVITCSHYSTLKFHA